MRLKISRGNIGNFVMQSMIGLLGWHEWNYGNWFPQSGQSQSLILSTHAMGEGFEQLQWQGLSNCKLFFVTRSAAQWQSPRTCSNRLNLAWILKYSLLETIEEGDVHPVRTRSYKISVRALSTQKVLPCHWWSADITFWNWKGCWAQFWQVACIDGDGIVLHRPIFSHFVRREGKRLEWRQGEETGGRGRTVDAFILFAMHWA